METHATAPPYTMLPVRGFGLAVDTSGLNLGGAGIEPGPEGTYLVSRGGKLVWETLPQTSAECGSCRIPVTENLHIYVNGNLTESGDGLTPETSVKSYDDAVRVAAKYDGSNLYNVHLHLADLDDTEARYPDISVYAHHYSTFGSMVIRGISRESTMLRQLQVVYGARVSCADLCAAQFQSISAYLYLSGKIAVKPISVHEPYIGALFGGYIELRASSDIMFHAGSYNYPIYSCGGSITCYDVKISSLGTMAVNTGFAYAAMCGVMQIISSSFTNCTVSGKKHSVKGSSCIWTGGGAALPGNLAGTADTGSVYI